MLPILYPFWGGPSTDSRSVTGGRYDRYIDTGASLVQLVAIEDAEAVLLPAAWEHVGGDAEARLLAHRLAERALAARHPLLVFFVSDSTDPVPLEGAVVFRTSLDRSRRRANEVAMPALTMDVLRQELGGTFVPRPWSPVPCVGFCGYAPGAQPLRTPESSSVRYAAVRVSRVAGCRTASTRARRRCRH